MTCFLLAFSKTLSTRYYHQRILKLFRESRIGWKNFPLFCTSLTSLCVGLPVRLFVGLLSKYRKISQWVLPWCIQFFFQIFLDLRDIKLYKKIFGNSHSFGVASFNISSSCSLGIYKRSQAIPVHLVGNF